MNNKRWSDSEKEFLESHYQTHSVKYIAFTLGREVNAIRLMATEMKLTKKHVFWSSVELQFINENHRTMKISELSQKLGRTERAIAHKLTELHVYQRASRLRDKGIIEDNIPFNSSKANEYAQILVTLKIGQSFVYPARERQTVVNQIKYLPGRVFKTRSISKDERRCWRMQ